MKSGVQRKAGAGLPSPERRSFWLAVVALILSGASLAQALYKYQGADGEWIYSDRPPPDGDDATEVRALPQGTDEPVVSVTHGLFDRQIRFSARNEYYAPVEILLALEALRDVGLPPADQPLRWVLEPRSDTELLRLDATEDAVAPRVEYRYVYMPGDPTAEHRPKRAYRAPFANAKAHRISQTFPLSLTHNTPDSRYAVDIAMPIGTDVYAARSGVVVEVASTNFRGGADTTRAGAEANIVRILHEDGTFAIYAHLNWNTIRVRPGDAVERGEYIADSGNTGFSTGPHLHFAVLMNQGLRIVSLPVVFEGSNGTIIEPETGMELTAY